MRNHVVRDVLFGNPFLRRHFFEAVLPDCRAVNPRVEPSDLFTHYLTMVFRNTS